MTLRHSFLPIALGIGLMAPISASIEPPDLVLGKRVKACFGQPATLFGSSRSDVLIGTNRNDTIHAGKGDDSVFGLRGNDRICGGTGDDTLDGMDNFDRIQGGPGKDFCQGERLRRCETGFINHRRVP